MIWQNVRQCGRPQAPWSMRRAPTRRCHGGSGGRAPPACEEIERVPGGMNGAWEGVRAAGAAPAGRRPRAKRRGKARGACRQRAKGQGPAEADLAAVWRAAALPGLGQRQTARAPQGSWRRLRGSTWMLNRRRAAACASACGGGLHACSLDRTARHHSGIARHHSRAPWPDCRPPASAKAPASGASREGAARGRGFAACGGGGGGWNALHAFAARGPTGAAAGRPASKDCLARNGGMR